MTTAKENIATAQKLGLTAIPFKDAMDLHKTLGLFSAWRCRQSCATPPGRKRRKKQAAGCAEKSAPRPRRPDAPQETAPPAVDLPLEDDDEDDDI